MEPPVGLILTVAIPPYLPVQFSGETIRFKTVEAARRGVFDYIEGWYNTRRRHSGIEYHSPMEYERLHQKIA
jgi:transposase InsO family protein